MEQISTTNNKRADTPYTIPDDFFRDLESCILKQTIATAQPHDKRRKPLSAISRAILATAASILLFFAVHTAWKGTSADLQGKVEQAFNSLPQEDQTYLLETYQDDIFLNQQNND